MEWNDGKGHASSLLPDGEWVLAWNDEFDGTELDRTKWMFRMNYWGQRFPAYTDKGVELDGESHAVFRPVVEDGMLRSSQLQTGTNSWDYLDMENLRKGNKKNCGSITWPLQEVPDNLFLHRYGYYETRVKFNNNPVWWSAFWMQSPVIGMTSDPGYCGIECDMMENFLWYDPDRTFTCGNIFGGYGKGFKESGRIYAPAPRDGAFHRIGMLWEPDGYTFYLDGKEMSHTDSPVSHIPEFLLLSTEINGYREGKPKTEWTEEELNDTFVCDYVRVFDRKK